MDKDDQDAINEAEWHKPDNWSFGIYFSKRDTRVWVPKSVKWMGWTLNLGRRGGVIWLFTFLIGLPLFLIALMIWMAASK